MKKTGSIIIMIVGSVLIILGITTVIPSDLVYNAHSYVGADSYNLIIESALRGGHIAGAMMTKAVYIGSGAIIWCLGFLLFINTLHNAKYSSNEGIRLQQEILKTVGKMEELIKDKISEDNVEFFSNISKQYEDVDDLEEIVQEENEYKYTEEIDDILCDEDVDTEEIDDIPCDEDVDTEEIDDVSCLSFKFAKNILVGLFESVRRIL